MPLAFEQYTELARSLRGDMVPTQGLHTRGEHGLYECLKGKRQDRNHRSQVVQ